MKYFVMAAMLVACGDKEGETGEPEEEAEQSEEAEEESE